MKLHALHVENFKSFDDETFPLRDITLLYGPNSAGKSSILQVLMLLKQSARITGSQSDGELEFRGPLVDLGGYGASIKDHDERRSLTIGLEIHRSADDEDLFGFGQRMRFTFRHEWDESRRAARMSSARMAGLRRSPNVFATRSDNSNDLYLAEAGARPLLQRWAEARGDSIPDVDLKDLSWVQGWLRRTPARALGWVPFWSPREIAAGRPGRPVGGSLDSPRRRLLQQFIFDWQNWAYDSAFFIENMLNEMSYVGPLREAPRRVHVEGGSVAEGMGVRGERAARLLARDPDLLWRVNAALKMLEIPYEVVSENLGGTKLASALGELSALILRDKRSGVILTPGDVGFGISQILPVVLQLLLSKNSIICIEQPEIHLHPRLQSRLADVIIASYRLRGNQVIVETHSEHLLLRLQRRIRGGSLSSRDVGVLFVDRSEEGSFATQIQLDKSGQMKSAWPQGFFDERLEDLLVDDEVPLEFDARLGE